MQRRQVIVLLAVVAAAAGCSNAVDGIAASVRMGEPVTMAPGEVRLIGESLFLRFDDVQDDSRCPIDAVCIWEGDALVHLSIGFVNPQIMAPVILLELHAGPGGPASAAAYGYTVSLSRLDPQPRAGVPIPAGNYRALIVVRPGPLEGAAH